MYFKYEILKVKNRMAHAYTQTNSDTHTHTHTKARAHYHQRHRYYCRCRCHRRRRRLCLLLLLRFPLLSIGQRHTHTSTHMFVCVCIVYSCVRGRRCSPCRAATAAAADNEIWLCWLLSFSVCACVCVSECPAYVCPVARAIDNSIEKHVVF